MNRKKLSLAVAGLLILIMSFSLAGEAAAQPPEGKVLRLIVQVEPGADIEKLTRDYGGSLRHSFPGSVVSVDLSEDKLVRLRGDFRVRNVRPAVRVEAIQDTLDWGVDRIDAEKVWGGVENAADVVGGRNAGDGINVAIIDTGIDWNHPDLAANYQGGYDFVNDDADPMDDNGHGTHVAGIVAASDNDSGVIGVAPEAYLYAVKVLDSDGGGWEDDVAAGIQWCIDNGIQIINMSLGSSAGSSLIKDACDAAYDTGLLVVAASGNYGGSRRTDTVGYPARYDSVIAVGAIYTYYDRFDIRVWFSSTGPDLELAAPGYYIYSTYWDDTYATLNGTSMACPMVTGTAALVWRANPGYTNVQVRQRLQNTAEDLGMPGRDWEFGYGLVDAEAAAASSADFPPTVSIVNPPDGATVSGNALIQASASDDLGIDTVEYCIDSGAYQPMAYTSGYWQATWDSTAVGDGAHTITAKATDTIGQESTDSIPVTVNNNVDQPPTVSITSPSDGATVSGNVLIQASASDDMGVDYVAFYIDDTPLATDNVAPYQCSWNTTAASDGSHVIKAVATDTASQTAQDTVTVTVDNTEPAVTVVEPTEGATVSGVITIQASVTETNIDKVEYQIDGGSLASMTYNAPYWEASWNSAAVGNGAHTVTVQATDGADNSGSDTNNFTVDNQVQGQTLHVQSLEMTLVQLAGGKFAYATATVTVVDATGNPVQYATVSGHWEGATTGMGYGISSTSGQVTFRSRAVLYPTSGTTFIFVIDSVTKDGWTYDPSANGDFNGDGTPGDTTNSITVP